MLLAVFIAFLALAYVTYRNVYNLDTRLRKIEDILKNAQVVAEPVKSPRPPVDLPSTADLPRPSAFTEEAHYTSVPTSRAFEDRDLIQGWGGSGNPVFPKVTVAKEDTDSTRKVEVIPEVSETDMAEDADDEASSTDIGVEDEEALSDDDEMVDEDGGVNVGEDGDVDGDVDVDVDEDDENVDDILKSVEETAYISETSSKVAEPSTEDYTSTKVADLKKALRANNIAIPSGAKKADLVSLVKENRVVVEMSTGVEEDDA